MGKKDMNISLTPKLAGLIREKVDSGLYNNASEVIREALRLMRQHDELHRIKLKRLRGALAKGEADLVAGRVTTLSNDREVDRFFAKL